MPSSFWLATFIMLMSTVRMRSMVLRGLRASKWNFRPLSTTSHFPPFSGSDHDKLLSLGISTIPRSSFTEDFPVELKAVSSMALSPELKHYMKSRFQQAFAQRSQRLSVAENQGGIERGTLYADRLISLIVVHPVYSCSNAEFSAIGLALCRSVPLLTEENVQQLLCGHIELQSILEVHQNHLKKNKKVFDTIQQHHRNIGREDWTDVAKNDEALAKYSQAAAAMGAKKWVMECNEWMESFAIGYFKLGGARKHYLREYFKVHDATFSSVAAKKEFINQFTKDLLQEPTRKQVRLLDVGSCYNPIARSENASFFDVTALDLYPADPSVYRCDFLNLAVGAAGSTPVTSSPAINNSEASDGMQTAVSPELAQLPAESFDAVTMSLVLSYLPTPDQRQQMIRKARSLLVTPPPSSLGPVAEPHRTGLLLIVEKDSIFGSENMVETVGQNKSVLLTNWKQAICDEGFELVKYRHLKTGGEHMSHVFAFATTAALSRPDTPHESWSSEANATVTGPPKMWIKQDFDAQLDNSESRSPDPVAISEIPRRVLPARPVGIIGGGIGGCALALSLQQKNIPFVVFEKDDSFETRKQGYALTMQQGGPALRALGLGDLLNTHGTVSTRHNSYRWDGTRLGTYGLSKRQPVASASGPVMAPALPDCPSTDRVPTKSAVEESSAPKASLLKSKTRHNVHIPRQKLREIMMQNIKPSSVLWSKKLESLSVQQVEDSVDPVVRVSFSDGTSQEVCALVGADGIFSSVRHRMQELLAVKQKEEAFDEGYPAAGNRLQEQSLKYLGLMVILGIAPNGPVMAADASTSGTSRQQCQWLDGETRVFSMPYDEHHTMWQLSYPCSEADALQMSGAATTPTQSRSSPISTNATASDSIGSPVGMEARAVLGGRLKHEALRRCAGWAPDLVALLTSAEPSLVSGHPVYDRDPELLSVLGTADVDHNTTPPSDDQSGEVASVPLMPVCWPITLLGDAAHPMSPFKGQGANQAILDALALSKAISSSNLFGSRGIRSLRSFQADGGLVNSVSIKCDARRSIAENLRIYESEMFAKGAEKVQRSRDAAFYLHNESALAEGNITRAKAAEDFANSSQI